MIKDRGSLKVLKLSLFNLPRITDPPGSHRMSEDEGGFCITSREKQLPMATDTKVYETKLQFKILHIFGIGHGILELTQWKQQFVQARIHIHQFVHNGIRGLTEELCILKYNSEGAKMDMYAETSAVGPRDKRGELDMLL